MPGVHQPSPADSHELRPLTGVRALAAGAVVWYHFRAPWEMLLPGLQIFGDAPARGLFGVDLFFILSGFILAYVYRAGKRRPTAGEHARFLWLRFARIFPNHLATLAALALLLAGGGVLGLPIGGDYPLRELPFQLTLTHAWPGIQAGGWNYPSWSISAEWFAYLAVFPLAGWLLRARLPGWVWLAAAYAVLGTYLAFSFPALRIPGWALCQVTAEFLAGALLFGAYAASPALAAAAHRTASATLLANLGAAIVLPDSPWANVLLILLFPWLLLGLTSERSWAGAFLSTRLLLWGGRVSYALYMSHALAQKVVKVALPAEWFAGAALPSRVAVTAAHLALILGMAAALYYLVEIPARNYLRRWGNRKAVA